LFVRILLFIFQLYIELPHARVMFKNIPKLLFFVTLLSVIMFAVINRLGKRNMNEASSGVVVQAKDTTSGTVRSSPVVEFQRIFCYGDSLTAGRLPQPNYETYPYAPYLQAEIQKSGILKKSIVNHTGLPGWTASQMLQGIDSDKGLRTKIRKIQDPSLSLVILLAGTNDLGHRREPAEIAQDILDMHKLCHDEGVPHTIAIGVPSSAYQSHYPEAKEKANQVNQAVEQFCDSEPKATYVPFPFDFKQGDEKWASDGLHFSQIGYQVLAENLAPIVEKILVEG
jgi:lysophospholipase L1-like esterase